MFDSRIMDGYKWAIYSPQDVIKSTQKILGGRKLIKIQNILDGKALNKKNKKTR